MPTSREFQHGDEHWIVREVDARTVPGARAKTCLICETADVIRRLWEFPKDWTSLTDEALWRICEGEDSPLRPDARRSP